MIFPLVSIIVVNWNGRRTIRTCLGSLANLSYSNFEIMVVDNGSSDESARIVEEEFPRVRLFRTCENLGFARACNIGIGMARGHYVALVANDICVDRLWLVELVNSFDSEKVGAAGGTIYYQEPGNIIWGGGGKIDLLTGQIWLPGAFSSSTNSDNVDFIPGGAILISSALFNKVGLLDEDYFLYGEDLDFCLRAQRAGYMIKFVSSARAWHLVHVEQAAISPRTYYYTTTTRMSIYFSHFPLGYLISVYVYELIAAPFFETFFFRQSALCFVLRLQAFLGNLSTLKRTFIKRRANKMLGKSNMKRRPKELFSVFRERFAARIYRYR